MSTKLSAESFLNLVKQSGLIDLEQVRKLCKGFQEAGQNIEDPMVLAEQLIAKNSLTRWQAEKLLAGKHKGFFLGKYRLLSLLGTGGMSSVYLAEHVLMRRRVAIKILPQQRVEDSSYLQRFHREAQAVAALDHRNIVRAYDVDVDGKNHFLVMEYVAGKNLMELVQQNGVLSYVKACEYMRQAADGLSAAHKASMVHRDIKPGNLLLDDKGTIKLLDLGLARFFNEGEENSLTIQHDEKVLGTADYLSPEQARDSHNVDIRSDIYSLGCTLYFLLTGHPPFPDGTMAMRLLAHQQKEPASLRKDRPDVPDSIIAICDKMMAKDVAVRYQTARETALALQQWLTENGGTEWSDMNPVIAAGSMSGGETPVPGSNTRLSQSSGAQKPSTITPGAKSDTPAPTPAAPTKPAASEIDPALAAFFNTMAASPPASGVSKASKSGTHPAPQPVQPPPKAPAVAPPASPTDSSPPAKPKSSIKSAGQVSAPADAELASFFSSLAETSVGTKPSSTPRPAKAAPVADAGDSAKVNGATPAQSQGSGKIAAAAPDRSAAKSDVVKPAAAKQVAPAVPPTAAPVAMAPIVTAPKAPVAAPVVAAKEAKPELVISLPEPAEPVVKAAVATTTEEMGEQDDNLTAFFSGLNPGKAKPAAKTPVPAATSPAVPAPLVAAPVVAAPEIAVAPAAPVAAAVRVAPAAAGTSTTAPEKAAEPAKPVAGRVTAPAPDFSWVQGGTVADPEPVPEINLKPTVPAAATVAPVVAAQPTPRPSATPVAQAIPVAAPVAPAVASPVEPTPVPTPNPQPTAGKTAKKGLSPAMMGGGAVLVVLLLAGAWFAFGPKSAPRDAAEKEKPKVKAPKRTVASNVPMTRVLQVGPGAKYTTISSALDEVRKNFNASRRAVQVLRVTATTYPERIVLDSTYHRGVQFEVVGTQPAILSPPGNGPVVEIKGDYEGFRLENFRIEAKGRPVAVLVQGGVSDALFKRLTITGFTESAIHCQGLMANLGAATRFESITFQPETPQAVGIRFTGPDSIRAEIHRCRFMGPMPAGIVYDSQAVLEMDFDSNIFSETATGIRFAGAAKHCKNLTFANNTFYKLEKGIAFETMLSKESTEIGFFNNLFVQVKVTPAIVEKDFNEPAFSSMYAIREGTGRDNNWSDGAATPVAGAIRICEEGSGRLNVSGLQFVSTDPASPDFLTPAPGSPLLNTPSMQNRPTHVGAVGKK